MKNLIFVTLLGMSTITLAGCSASVDIDTPHHHHAEASVDRK